MASRTDCPSLGSLVTGTSRGNNKLSGLAGQGTTKQILLDKERIIMPFASYKLLPEEFRYERVASRWNDITACSKTRHS